MKISIISNIKIKIVFRAGHYSSLITCQLIADCICIAIIVLLDEPYVRVRRNKKQKKPVRIESC